MFKVFIVLLGLTVSVNLVELTYYEILGVTKHASIQEIRQAYKKLVVKFHPDKNPDSSVQDNFLKITEAYEILKDSDSRRKYDLYGKFSTYTRTHDYQSQSDYNNILYNGLYHDDPYVQTLSGESFYTFLSTGFHFVNFYSPFCPPCQKLESHWKKLAKIYKGIIKVGAVNCKRYNSFCYNSMRIGSYPSLLFYPNGKRGNYLYYRGEQTLEALDKFVMSYMSNSVHVPTISQLRGADKPMVYVLGENRIDRHVVIRIAYHLKDLATVVIVEDDNLRTKLTKDDYTTVVFKHKAINKEIQSFEERDIVAEITAALPSVEYIDIEKLKRIRNDLRMGSKTPWLLYFSEDSDDTLQLHQMKADLREMNIGQIDCEKWSQLCLSLQVEASPAWAMLKQGGVYQRILYESINTDVIRNAAKAGRLHSLSMQEFTRILDGVDTGAWALLVLPHQSKSEKLVDAFTQASLNYQGKKLEFGIVSCAANSDHHCERVAPSGPAIVVTDGTKVSYYSGRPDGKEILDFIELLKEDADLLLSEDRVLEIIDPGREEPWLVAYLPAGCGQMCEQILHEWRVVAKKMKSLELVRVGVLQCSGGSSGFCVNVRGPTAKLYPAASAHHYTVNLRNINKSHLVLQWVFSYLDDFVKDLNWHTFSKLVIADELNPSPNRKPWLVYFHSPRCHHCHEMYPDFAMAGKDLQNAVNLGKVNCLNERNLCQHEQITSYPSMRLYLNRNQHHKFSSTKTVHVREYNYILQDVRPHLKMYNEDLLVKIDSLHVKSQGFGFHDEF